MNRCTDEKILMLMLILFLLLMLKLMVLLILMLNVDVGADSVTLAVARGVHFGAYHRPLDGHFFYAMTKVRFHRIDWKLEVKVGAHTGQ